MKPPIIVQLEWYRVRISFLVMFRCRLKLYYSACLCRKSIFSFFFVVQIISPMKME